MKCDKYSPIQVETWLIPPILIKTEFV